MTRTPQDLERSRVFRRMEWVYATAPPILALLIAGFGSALLAFVVPLSGTTFWGRWVLAMVVVLVIPALVYLLRSRLGSGD